MVALIQRAIACDLCSCSSIGALNNLSAFATNSFVIFRPWYSAMHATGDIQANAVTTGADFLVGLAEGERLHLMAYVPFRYNTFDHQGTYSTFYGIGDVGVLTNVALFSNGRNMMARRKYVISGRAGMELPSGQFNESFRLDEVPAAIATGSGSVDFLFGARAILRSAQHAYTLDYTVKWHTVNSVEYRFGTQQMVSGFYNYRIKLPGMNLLPNAGITFETSSGDTFHEVAQSGTDGYAVFGIAGLECAWNNFAIGAQMDIPVISQYSTDVRFLPKGMLRFVYLLPG